MHAYWRAANYLSVGQIYLMDNPLLKEALQLKHVKPRLLGHWGTTSLGTRGTVHGTSICAMTCGIIRSRWPHTAPGGNARAATTVRLSDGTRLSPDSVPWRGRARLLRGLADKGRRGG